MFRNAKVGDKVWDFIYGWGNIINVRKDYSFPIVVSFGNGKITSYKFNGKYDDTEINPRLFLDEIKYEIPKKTFSLKEEMQKLEKVEFEAKKNNYFLFWDAIDLKIKKDFLKNTELPLIKYFSKYSIDEFIKNIKDRNIIKEEFLKTYKEVFGDE